MTLPVLAALTPLDSTELLYGVVAVLISVTGVMLMCLVGVAGYFLAALHTRFEAHMAESRAESERLTRLEERFCAVDEIRVEVREMKGTVDRIEGVMESIETRLERRKKERETAHAKDMDEHPSDG